MMHHYLQKGIPHTVLENLKPLERLFYMASLALEREDMNDERR
jgi:hypothetical protein